MPTKKRTAHPRGRRPAADANYEVGYRRPPREYQFKDGQSGNPDGRRRGSLNKKTLRTIAAVALLDSTVIVKERGRQLKVSKLEGLIRKLTHEGLQGDRRAIMNAWEIAERLAEAEPPVSTSQETPEEDAAILSRFGFDEPPASGEDEAEPNATDPDDNDPDNDGQD